MIGKIDKKKIMEESETITKFRNDIYNMMQKEIIRFTTPLKFEISELNKELTKYKRAFEILKDKLNIEFGKYDFSVTPNYYKDLEYFADVKSSFELTKEEYELLEELMSIEH